MTSGTIRNTLINNLQVSLDYDEDLGPTVVFLFTPDMAEPTDHYHIVLGPASIDKLVHWLKANT